MTFRIKTKNTWRRHLPQRPYRVRRAYYSRDRNKQRKIVIRIIWTIVVILLVQSIFQVKYLRVESIELINNKDLTLEEVQSALQDKLTAAKYLIFKNNNYFLLKTKPLEEILMAEYNLDDVEIKKVFPDKLKITLKEKISHFIWQKDDSLYLLDARGVLNRQISALDDKYIVLEDLRDFRPEEGQIFSKNEIDIINKVYLAWQDIIGSRLKLIRVVINDDWHLLQLKTKIGFYVKLDPTKDLYQQLQNLNRVLTAGNISGMDIDYIDVRFGDKVYFK